MFKPKGSTQFNCFSPPVMLATFIIETTLACYSLWRYKMNVLGRLVVTSLVALALFQLCEYHVCGGWGMRAEEWARVGFVAITLLPPLGLHILYVLGGNRNRRLVMAAYVTMLACCAYFLAAPNAFSGYACTGNYVIFQIGTSMAGIYGVYYYGWLVTAMALAVRWANGFMKAGNNGHTRLLATRGLIVGYLIFLVPTALANSVKPETRRGIPSIMCGFAVLFALILTMYVLPKLGEKRSQISS